MIRVLLLVLVLASNAFAQQRGQGITRGERDRLRHRPYQPMYYPQYQPPIVITPSVPVYSSSRVLMMDAAEGLIRGCEVRLHVSNWANQLYVNGNFAGNFREGSEDYLLSEAIRGQLNAGVCRYRSNYEMSLIRSPYLIQDFASGRSYNCYVKLGVSQWANQVYINGQFRGNYDMNTEVTKLKSALVDYIVSGICQY